MFKKKEAINNFLSFVQNKKFKQILTQEFYENLGQPKISYGIGLI